LARLSQNQEHCSALLKDHLTAALLVRAGECERALRRVTHTFDSIQGADGMVDATHTLDHSRILIIDDNPAIHDDFRKVLGRVVEDDGLGELRAAVLGKTKSPTTRRAEFDVEFASQGQQGLEAVREANLSGRPFSLAFVDMRMPPGWDGLETIEHLWEVDPDLHVVICTAYADYTWSDVVERLGNDDRWLILKKPFDNAEVCQMAAALTQKRRLVDQVKVAMCDLLERVDQGSTALLERKERMQAMFETAPDGIVVFGPDGNVESANSAASSLFGYGPTELVGRNVVTLLEKAVSYGTSHASVSTLFRVGSCGLKSSDEFDSVRKSGQVFPAQWTVGYYASSQHEFYTAIVRDLTDQKRLQCELAQAQRLESVGQLAAGIAHEINTPTQYVGDNVRFLKEAFRDLNSALAALTQLLEQCGSGPVDQTVVDGARAAIAGADIDYLVGEVPQAVDQALDGIEKISSIVRAMKEFSHPGSDDKTLVDLHAALETTITVARNEWKYVADVVTEFAPNMPSVPCLAGELNQVFLNLIVNAAHAIGDVVRDDAGSRGTITIRTHHDADWAEVRISDTGTGIPKEIIGRVFDPFFTTKEVGKGTGQGLAIARSVVVDKHRGAIDIQTDCGKGTTFRIRLPLVDYAAMNMSSKHQGAGLEPQRIS